MSRDRWIAGPDGIGHLETRREPRTACGNGAVGEQHAWPTIRRCLECMATQATSALPEELLLAGYGVRQAVPMTE